jgi:transaldolase
VLYVSALGAPNTIDTMPEETLLSFAGHGTVGRPLPRDGGDAEQVLAAIARTGIDVAALARQLQDEGANSFVASWKDLLGAIEKKSKALT